MIHSDRLASEANIWLATTRSDGRPHLVPIWFVWHDEQFYILTILSSVKARNLLANSRASLALENGSQPLIAECTARLMEAPYSSELVQAFLRKYDWDITKDGEYNAMFALTPLKWLTWNA
jgi:nitroimidazol reductase NimA-like FMN-containing flavoprotein (pyridoxamine 5'-phosphate oxidase superfamily)